MKINPLGQSDILEAMEEYYKLKKSYDYKYEQMKSKIIQNESLSKRDKHKRFKMLKLKCIECKRDGGTIFTNKNNILKAVCGHISDPCDLHIEIDKGEVHNLENLTKHFKYIINLTKNEIIINKLNLLFGYENEEKVIQIFEKLKQDLAKLTETYHIYESKYLNIVFNKDNLEKLKQIHRKLYDYDGYIQTFKNSLRLYQEEDNETYLTNALENYVENIIPLLELNMITKYQKIYVEFNETDNTYHLIEIPIKISSLETTLNKDPKIISNIK